MEFNGEFAMIGIIGLAFGFAFWNLFNNNRKIGAVVKNAQLGNFKVLDCIPTKLDIAYGGDGSSDAGIAYIKTIQGEKCCDKFILDDILSIKKDNGTCTLPLLLIAMPKQNYYLMVTETMLNKYNINIKKN